MTRTLIIAAHMDDESISCGGLIQARVKAGGTVQVIAVFGRVYDWGRESGAETYKQERSDFEHACTLLGAESVCYNLREGEPFKQSFYSFLELIETAIDQFKPTELVVHGELDRNQDHQFLAAIMDIVTRPAVLGGITRVLQMIPLDGGLRYKPQYFVSLTRNELNHKIVACNSYRRERRSLPHPRCSENIEAMARVFGSQCGVEFAEGYCLLLGVEVS